MVDPSVENRGAERLYCNTFPIISIIVSTAVNQFSPSLYSVQTTVYSSKKSHAYTRASTNTRRQFKLSA